jgi:hypothetical protein
LDIYDEYLGEKSRDVGNFKMVKRIFTEREGGENLTNCQLVNNLGVEYLL